MSLIHIESFVDPIVKELTQKSLDKISSLLIALQRIRKGWMDYFEDFLSFLKKIEVVDPELSIFLEYLKYLKNKLGNEPHQRLYNFLENKGYDESKLSAILLTKTYDEGALINRLSKNNTWYLWLCIFYLYQPRLSQKFFWDKLAYLSSKDEEDLLNNYRALPFDIQKKVSQNIQQIIKSNSKNSSN